MLLVCRSSLVFVVIIYYKSQCQLLLLLFFSSLKVTLLADVPWPGALSALNTFFEVVGESNANIKILDLGAGTGTVGLDLSKHGYTNVDAIDVSKKMLDKAKEKHVYKNYICEAVTDRRLNIATGTYDAIISCGVITSGYVKSNAFDEIVRLVRPGEI